ncbi:GreA/GreB family elongation factor [Thermoanaerobacterium sp. DL9XJH110]|uniref:GreA/GreB family elongation factor n=1 Tax=Thermoanaerobacterium sp. DL9XJH110 TaxID=3386643 RepID=UPI003BB78B20
MKKTYALSKTAFEAIVKQLANLEADKHKLVDEFFNDSSYERTEFELLLDNYIRRLDDFIRSARPADSVDGSLPFVIIDSRVEVLDIENEETYSFRVIMPSVSRDASRDIYDISILSPVGKSLLLKNTGEKVQVNAPGGVFSYEIKSIKFP